MVHAILRRVGLLAVAAAFAVGSPVDAGQYNTVATLGMTMPTFQGLPATDGTNLSSADVKEDVVVLVFLANHCPWVRGMDGDLVKLAQELQGRSVRVIGVAVNPGEEDGLPAMKVHAAKVGYPFTYVYDESQALGRALGATRTPEYFVFDQGRKLVYLGAIHDSPARMKADGTVAYTAGPPGHFYVRDAVVATLEGKPVAEPETRAQGCSVVYKPSGG